MGSDQPIKNCTIKYEWWTEDEHKNQGRQQARKCSVVQWCGVVKGQDTGSGVNKWRPQQA